MLRAPSVRDRTHQSASNKLVQSPNAPCLAGTVADRIEFRSRRHVRFRGGIVFAIKDVVADRTRRVTIDAIRYHALNRPAWRIAPTNDVLSTAEPAHSLSLGSPSLVQRPRVVYQ